MGHLWLSHSSPATSTLRKNLSNMAYEMLPTTTAKKRRIMIITGDESLIEQIQNGEHSSLIKSCIVELHDDDDEEPAHTSNQAEISASNRKKAKKRLMTCVVCGSVALGYHFNAITCESCKAFFRRNGLKDPRTFRCRQKGDCEITVEPRRQCSACRLAECLRMGMTRDRLLTTEEKVAKRREIEQNRTSKTKDHSDTDNENSQLLPSEFLDQSSSFEETNLLSPTNVADLLSLTLSPLRQALLSSEDLQRVETIQISYNQRIELAARDGLPWDPSVGVTTLLQHLNSRSVSAMRLLTFFKQIPEFNELIVDDRVTLIKYNLKPLFMLNSTLSYNSETNQVKETDFDVPWNNVLFEEVHGTEMFSRVKKIFESFVRIAQYDQRIIQLALIVMIFTRSFSADSDASEPILNDGVAVYRAQNYFTELLWRYMETVHGSEKSTYIFHELVAHFISWQTLEKELRSSVRRHLTTTDRNELLPIMKSLLHMP